MPAAEFLQATTFLGKIVKNYSLGSDVIFDHTKDNFLFQSFTLGGLTFRISLFKYHTWSFVTVVVSHLF